MEKTKRKSYPIQIRFNDVDLYGHVNNAVYLTYFEEGRMLYFQDIIGTEWDWKTHGTVLARHEIDYKQPMRREDSARLELWISKLGEKSMEISYRITKKKGEDWVECTTGKSVVVTINYETGKTIPIPDAWVEVLVVGL